MAGFIVTALMLVALSALICIFYFASWYVFNDIVPSNRALWMHIQFSVHMVFDQLLILYREIQHYCLVIILSYVFLPIKKKSYCFLKSEYVRCLKCTINKDRAILVIRYNGGAQSSALNSGNRSEVSGYLHCSTEGKPKGRSEHREGQWWERPVLFSGT